MISQTRLFAASLGALLAVFATGIARADNDDPPTRVARLSYIHGATSFSPAGENEWVDTVVNRPLTSGDRLWTDKDGRAELEAGSSALRLDANTNFELVNLDDQTTQVQVTQGTLYVRLRKLSQGQNYEVDTPTLAVTLMQAGQYRIDVDPDGQHTTVVVSQGSADARGDNAEYPLQAGDRIRFHETNLSDAEQLNALAADDFDRFSAARDAREEHSASKQYVGNDVVGASDLDEYGSWSAQSAYGHVWYPSHVESNWAPYSDGHWMWQDPWGWTWVDNAPWGFAPSHYGRWVSVENRWGWVPGPRDQQAVYAPALVAFVGGGGLSVGISVRGAGPIGWFPLGARDIYEPPYGASRNYFTRVNVANTTINNTNITNVYGSYSSGRPLAQANYANRAIPGAVTAVPSTVFANAQPVRAAAIKLDSKALASTQITRMAAIAPSARSVIGNAPAATAKPVDAVLERKVVARTAPPPKPVPFAARQQELQRTPGRPLAPSAVAALQPHVEATAAAPNVRVLGQQAGAVNVRAAKPALTAAGSVAPPQGKTSMQPPNASASDQKQTPTAPPRQGAPGELPQHNATLSPAQKQAVPSLPQQNAPALPEPKRDAPPPSEQKHVVPSPPQQNAPPLPEPKRDAPPPPEQKHIVPVTPQHNAPPTVPEKTKDKKDESKDADKKDGGGK